MSVTEAFITHTKMQQLADAAWDVREKAFVFGNTRVGAAALTSDGIIFVGCNVEHRFRCHDVHAEVNAITNGVAHGYREFVAIVVAAERERFTPCGSCMDWIFQFGGPSCLVGYQSVKGGPVTVHKADELMPYYPK